MRISHSIRLWFSLPTPFRSSSLCCESTRDPGEGEGGGEKARPADDFSRFGAGRKGEAINFGEADFGRGRTQEAAPFSASEKGKIFRKIPSKIYENLQIFHRE